MEDLHSNRSGSPDNNDSSNNNSSGDKLDGLITALHERIAQYQKRTVDASAFNSPVEAGVQASQSKTSPREGGGHVSAGASGTNHPQGFNRTRVMSTSILSDPCEDSAQIQSSPNGVPIAMEPRGPLYWEERALFISAEDLCCHLNGGVNYRILCRQYQKVLDVLLRMVKEDIALSRSVEILPSGAMEAMSQRLRGLLEESMKMLRENGVEIPENLSAAVAKAALPGRPALVIDVEHNNTSEKGHGRSGRPTPTSATASNWASGRRGPDGSGTLRSPLDSSLLLRRGEAPVSALSEPHISKSAAASANIGGASSTPHRHSATFHEDCETDGNHLSPTNGGILRHHAGASSSKGADACGDERKRSHPEQASSLLHTSILLQNGVDRSPNPHPPSSSSLSPSQGAGTASTPTSPSAAELKVMACQDRWQRLHLLYGNDYRHCGVEMIKDVLSLVFRHEYDQGINKSTTASFRAFKSDVERHVLPSVETYNSLKLSASDATPLRGIYLMRCLSLRVKPLPPVLDLLNNMEERDIEILSMSNFKLGNHGTTAIVSLVHRLYRLRYLDLSQNALHDRVLPSLIAFLRHHPALEVLNLSRNYISDAALQDLLALAHAVPHLRSISLHGCPISESSQETLAREIEACRERQSSVPPDAPLSRESTALPRITSSGSRANDESPMSIIRHPADTPTPTRQKSMPLPALGRLHTPPMDNNKRSASEAADADPLALPWEGKTHGNANDRWAGRQQAR